MGRFVELFILSMAISSFSSVCTAIDSIIQGQSLSANQTITSAGGAFALGFFTAGPSTSSYLGIWYTVAITNRTVVWVANRESPLPSPGVFTIGKDGNFLVLDGSRAKAVWSSNISASEHPAKNTTIGVLKDNGNLVLKQGDVTVWESFDHPSHTLLPGMKLSLNRRTGHRRFLTSWAGLDDPRPGNFTLGIDPTGPTQALVWNGAQPYWRSFIENGSKSLYTFTNSRGTAYYGSWMFEGEEYYITYSLSDDTAQQRGILTPTGQVEALLRMNSTRPWIVASKFPVKTCEFYGSCGPSGVCDENVTQSSPCKCLTGFKPKTPGDWGDGCVRKKKLNCDSGEGFLKFELIKLPDFSVAAGHTSISGCRSSCLKNCSCSAYAYFNSSAATTVRCLHWFGDLMDLTLNSVLGRDIYIRFQGSELSLKVPKKHKSPLVIAFPVLVVLLCSLIVFGYWFIRKRVCIVEETEQSKILESSNSIPAGGGHTDTELVIFKLRSILAATDNFSETRKLGEGGFGPVYKGNLPGSEVVAIKRLSKRSGQGFVEFINELRLIAKLQHTNLVRLLGCCAEKDENILVYEYMPNRSLDTFLFDPCEAVNLDWCKRFHIIEGIAQGLLYLHKYSRLKVIHRDLKASNILLDGSLNPKISDFGLARILGINQTEEKTDRVVGTYGYMSPEYALYGQFSEKSDVFSFGVLLLEIVSGRKNTDFHKTKLSLTIPGWAWDLWKEGAGLELIDPLMKDTCCAEEAARCIQIGLLCVQEAPAHRPTMSVVVTMLGKESALLPNPREPAFSSHCAAGDSLGRTCSTYFSHDGMSMSMAEPR